ncbi:MAG: ABC transporter ATP-binding protein [Victivallales bacterium]|nr:ABC transporter ATP-binding protein [Victivallales bacterium]
MIAIEFNNVSKQYRLGLVSTGTLIHDLNRFWQTKILRREDPYLKIGETNDRTSKGSSEYVWALRDIDFKVEQGDFVGIIGRNGAGKSTLLKLLSRVTSPTTGTIRARGRIASLLEVGTGFHPEMTGRENIYMNGSIMGMRKAEIDKKLDEIVDFSGCERYIDTPVKRYSSGMKVRLGFAIAAHLEPDILVVDEVLAVGDAEFQKKAIGKMQDVAHGGGRTVLFVSHNMRSVRNLCTSSVVLENGKIAFQGDVDSGISFYMQSSTLGEEDKDISSMPRSAKCTGEVRFTDIRFLNDAGEEEDPHCGKPMIARISYTASKDCSHCSMSVGVSDLYGGRIFSIPSLVTMERFPISKGNHEVDLVIPKLTLSPGEYLFGVHCMVDDHLADWIEYATKFNVLDDDFYGTGRMISQQMTGKAVLCEHNWKFRM